MTTNEPHYSETSAIEAAIRRIDERHKRMSVFAKENPTNCWTGAAAMELEVCLAIIREERAKIDPMNYETE